MSKELIEQFNRTVADDFLKQHGILAPDIQGLAVDQTPFEQRILGSSEEIRPGLVFESGSYELGDGNFMNSYAIRFKSSDRRYGINVLSRPKLFYLRKTFSDLEKVAAINGGFFFLSDEDDYRPVDASFNLCIRDGKVIGLPVVDRPAALIIDGQLETRQIFARGKIQIGNKMIQWIGAKSAHRMDFLGMPKLYNSACCQISYVKSEKTERKRVVVRDANRTPIDSNLTDIVIKQDSDGKLVVSDINESGGTDFFAGNFVLQLRKESSDGIKVGDIVSPLELSGISLDKIQSGITIGPSVKDVAIVSPSELEINQDLSLGTFPPFLNERKARSIIYKDKAGNIYLRIFDGAPKTDKFKGVTPSETLNIIESITPEAIEWAYYLDGGQSSRIIFRREEQIEIEGNLHYVKWPVNPDYPFLWNACNGRSIPSCLQLNFLSK